MCSLRSYSHEYVQYVAVLLFFHVDFFVTCGIILETKQKMNVQVGWHFEIIGRMSCWHEYECYESLHGTRVYVYVLGRPNVCVLSCDLTIFNRVYDVCGCVLATIYYHRYKGFSNEPISERLVEHVLAAIKMSLTHRKWYHHCRYIQVRSQWLKKNRISLHFLFVCNR